ncbi:transglutaminaseTgpA domain-containing protein [Nocardioides hwasunensis]|uniref:Transglutaminase domain-containing protein n=1 Tax=Nocardioides hwasunensis TaxID=397258 RepID=A0ABR8MG40_9ACTN|nr:transglutaminase domain-containing protein [Nocardioides hwasunensis]MBD3913084.1 transglutaminase domain-containing protein [Nocardioides hwasunensis]
MRTTSGTWTIVWAGALLVLGGLSLATAWSGPVPALCLAGAAVVPLAIGRAVLRLGISAWATAAVLVSLLVLGAYVLAADAGSSFSDTVTDAVPRLLTTARPLPVRADLLVGPLLLTALVSLLVAIRLTSDRRVAPVVGALVLYVAGTLLTAGEGDPRGLLASLLVACTLLGWVVLDEHRHRTARRTALAAVLALSATGLLAASTTLAWSRPFEPRTLVDPPTVDVVASNPLAHLGAWTSDPDRLLLEVAGPVQPLRLVTLDTYDGAGWTTGTRYQPVGEVTYDDSRPLLGTSPRTSTVRVEMVDIEGRWLPSPGWPTAVSDPDAVVEPTSGNLYLPSSDGIVRTGTSTSTRDLTYSVTAVADSPDERRLASATVPSRADLAPYLALPPLPQPLAAFAERSVTDAVTPYDRAVAIETLLHDRARLSPTAVSGSQLWRIGTFLLAERGTPGARVGTAEQFATSFAIMARHNGLPTRVVVGFRPDADARAGAGGWSVRGRHATAWPEVYFDELGWVPFTPTDERPPQRSDEETIKRGRGEDPGPGPDADDRESGTGKVDDPATPPTSERTDGPVVPAALVVGALLAILALLLAARRIRSWRHLRDGAVGAWAEGRDALRLAGMPVAAHQTADQVATMAGERLGTDAVHVLAAEAQRAAFAPPGTTVGEVMPALHDVRRCARRAVPGWRRWWWRFDPSVFLR